MTVACARCHDHKFDPISQRDYYALYGYLKSTGYQQARYEHPERDRRAAAELERLRLEGSGPIRGLVARAMAPAVERLPDYLDTAATLLRSRVVGGATSTVVFQDFEKGSYAPWTTQGEAFKSKPHAGAFANQQAVSGFKGKALANSYGGRDSLKGRLRSPAFTVDHRYIAFLVGGGAHAGQTCVNLVVDGKTVRTATGQNDEKLLPHSWDVQEFKGKSAVIEVVDDHSDGWGHINVDHFAFTDLPPDSEASPVPPEAIAAAARERGLDEGLLKRWTQRLTEKHPAHDPLAVLSAAVEDAKPAKALASWRAAQVTPHANPQPSNPAIRIIADYTRPDTTLRQNGFAFGARPLGVFDVQLTGNPVRPIQRVITTPAAYQDPAWNGLKAHESTVGSGRGEVFHAGKMLRTPSFVLSQGRVHYLVQGKADVYAPIDSHRVNHGPLHQQMSSRIDTRGRWAWHSQDLSRYIGSVGHLEFTPSSDEPFAVAMVVEGPNAPFPATEPGMKPLADAWQQITDGDVSTLAAALREACRGAIAAMSSERPAPESELAGLAALAQWMVQHGELWLPDSPLPGVERWIAPLAHLHAGIIKASRLAPVAFDGDGIDERLMIRGSPRRQGEPIARRFLEVFEGTKDAPAGKDGSGRLELARRIADRDNPMTARVMVNRLWHHLFGKGLVASVDDFGAMGAAPTHPELLDHLASRFTADGWSVKRMLRTLVLSRTYRQSSRPSPTSAARVASIDPSNLLLSHASVRRLQAEPVRDAMLAVSGRLDTQAFGPPVPVALNDFMDGRGKPHGGPIDGHGRRSVYISVRRNFLPAMMLAFDTPAPFSSMGRRSVSNVPAQALILMNDPFVIEQARRWAQRALADGSLKDPESRVTAMFREALGRQPSESERSEAVAFLREQGVRLGLAPSKALDHEKTWADLAHALFNAKEFVFLE